MSLTIAIEYPLDTSRGSVFGYTIDLVRALQQVAPGHRYLLLRQPSSAPFRTDQRLWWERVVLPYQLRRLKPNVYHAPFGAPPLPARCGCPVVGTVHDFIFSSTVAQLRWPAHIYNRHLLDSLEHATHLITDSQFVKQEAQRFIRYPAGQITPVWLGVDGHTFRPLDAAVLAQVREQFKLPEKYLLYAGTLEHRKGTDLLLQALARLMPRYPDLQLVLAGMDHWPTSPYYAQAASLNILGQIRHLGFVERPTLAALMNLAQVFVLPSRQEGFGLPVIEAMACGAPVIATQTSSLPEVAGQAARLIPANDIEALQAAIAALWGDRQLREDYRERGQQRASEFTWERTARQTLAVYTAVA